MKFKHSPPLTPFYLENESPEMRTRRERYEAIVTALRAAVPGSPEERAIVDRAVAETRRLEGR